ncbi:hypothetical protein ABPG74_009921 [Tetrahymena malaccensis]
MDCHFISSSNNHLEDNSLSIESIDDILSIKDQLEVKDSQDNQNQSLIKQEETNSKELASSNQHVEDSSISIESIDDKLDIKEHLQINDVVENDQSCQNQNVISHQIISQSSIDIKKQCYIQTNAQQDTQNKFQLGNVFEFQGGQDNIKEMDLDFSSCESSLEEKPYSNQNIDCILNTIDTLELKDNPENGDQMIINKQEINSYYLALQNESFEDNQISIESIDDIINIKQNLQIYDAVENNKTKNNQNVLNDQLIIQDNMSIKNKIELENFIQKGNQNKYQSIQYQQAQNDQLNFNFCQNLKQEDTQFAEFNKQNQHYIENQNSNVILQNNQQHFHQNNNNNLLEFQNQSQKIKQNFNGHDFQFQNVQSTFQEYQSKENTQQNQQQNYIQQDQNQIKTQNQNQNQSKMFKSNQLSQNISQNQFNKQTQEQNFIKKNNEQMQNYQQKAFEQNYKQQICNNNQQKNILFNNYFGQEDSIQQGNLNLKQDGALMQNYQKQDNQLIEFNNQNKYQNTNNQNNKQMQVNSHFSTNIIDQQVQNIKVDQQNQQEINYCFQCGNKLEFEYEFHSVFDELSKQQFCFCIEHIYLIISQLHSQQKQLITYNFSLLENDKENDYIQVDRFKIQNLLDIIIKKKFPNLQSQCYFCKSVQKNILINLLTCSQMIKAVICINCASKCIKKGSRCLKESQIKFINAFNSQDHIITENLFKNLISKEQQLSNNCQSCQKNIKHSSKAFNIENIDIQLNLCEECLKLPLIILERLNIKIKNTYFQQYQKSNQDQINQQNISQEFPNFSNFKNDKGQKNKLPNQSQILNEDKNQKSPLNQNQKQMFSAKKQADHLSDKKQNLNLKSTQNLIKQQNSVQNDNYPANQIQDIFIEMPKQKIIAKSICSNNAKNVNLKTQTLNEDTNQKSPLNQNQKQMFSAKQQPDFFSEKKLYLNLNQTQNLAQQQNKFQKDNYPANQIQKKYTEMPEQSKTARSISSNNIRDINFKLNSSFSKPKIRKSIDFGNNYDFISKNQLQEKSNNLNNQSKQFTDQLILEVVHPKKKSQQQQDQQQQQKQQQYNGDQIEFLKVIIESSSQSIIQSSDSNKEELKEQVSDQQKNKQIPKNSQYGNIIKQGNKNYDQKPYQLQNRDKLYVLVYQNNSQSNHSGQTTEKNEEWLFRESSNFYQQNPKQNNLNTNGQTTEENEECLLTQDNHLELSKIKSVSQLSNNQGQSEVDTQPSSNFYQQNSQQNNLITNNQNFDESQIYTKLQPDQQTIDEDPNNLDEFQNLKQRNKKY